MQAFQIVGGGVERITGLNLYADGKTGGEECGLLGPPVRQFKNRTTIDWEGSVVGGQAPKISDKARWRP